MAQVRAHEAEYHRSISLLQQADASGDDHSRVILTVSFFLFFGIGSEIGIGGLAFFVLLFVGGGSFMCCKDTGRDAMVCIGLCFSHDWRSFLLNEGAVVWSIQ